MLTNLNIQNIVLIENMTIDFQSGLCALTGETGAGKSILLDSLGLVLGLRADAGLVRHGADKSSVSAVFDVAPNHNAFDILKNADMDVDQSEGLILRRALTSEGRSKAYINDQAVSASLMRDVGQTLVEIHGQFDTRGLMDVKNHRVLLDDYAGLDLQKIKTAWQTWRGEKKKLQTMQDLANNARDEEEYLRESLEDLDTLSPQSDEENKLSSLREKLMHKDQVLEALNTAYAALNQDQNPVRQAWGGLDRVAAKVGGDAVFEKVIQSLERATHEADEAMALLQGLAANMMETEHDLESIDDRLYRLRAQARKHHCDVDDLPQKREELAEKLNLIENSDEALVQQIQKTEKALQAYINYAEEAHDKRANAACNLDQSVMKELAPLKLEKARFVTDVSELDEERWGEEGFSRVAFMIATNPGADPGPINKVASGGELSRIMLAIKVAMVQEGAEAKTAQPVMIFDEVDAGVGGATADAVGQRLHRLTHTQQNEIDRQIMVVTHSPQVAAKAQAHFIVSKEEASGAVKTSVTPLTTEHERREELARMLAGAEITNEARAAAQKLLETSQENQVSEKSAA